VGFGRVWPREALCSLGVSRRDVQRLRLATGRGLVHGCAGDLCGAKAASAISVPVGKLRAGSSPGALSLVLHGAFVMGVAEAGGGSEFLL